MTEALLTALRAELPDEAIITDPDIVESYRHDMATFCASEPPAVVVRPTSTADVRHVLEVANRLGVPVVPQGARSGLSGGANTAAGSVALSMQRMDRILQVDPANRLAVVQPGVLTADLARAVAEHGLFYPPDPSSWELSTIGGNVATNAGGLCCVKYGVTADFVLGLEVVLGSGEVVRTGRRTAKGVAGYDLTRLLVGSEGTLGVVTEVTVRLRPAAHAPQTVAAMFPTVASAGDAVSRIVASGQVPSLLEFLDQTSLRAVNTWRDMGLPEDAAAMLVAQSDAPGELGRAEIHAMAATFEAAGAFDVVEAADAQEGELLLMARRSVHYAIDELGTRLIDDVCVPQSTLAEFVQRIEKVAADTGLTIAVVGHFGDGNTHPNVIFDATDTDQVARARAAFAEIMRIGLELGGTVTGEHGVGLLKREWLSRELGPVAMRLHRQLKQAFDPRGILNPGKVFEA